MDLSPGVTSSRIVSEIGLRTIISDQAMQMSCCMSGIEVVREVPSVEIESSMAYIVEEDDQWDLKSSPLLKDADLCTIHGVDFVVITS